MKSVLRFDGSRGSLRSPQRTPQGFLRADGYAARAGIYEYPGDNGKVRRELRPESEVFHADSLASYDGASITDGHPRKSDGSLDEVTAANVKRLEVGTVMGAGRADGDHVAVGTVIKHDRAISDVESRRKQELSPGYRIDLDETPGVHPRWGRYDAVQRNIRINHLALVERGRGGSSVRLRMDSAEDERIGYRTDEVLDAKERHALPAEDFAVPGSEGLPISDAVHLRAAMARFGQYKFADAAERKSARARILKKAKELDVDASGFADEHRADGDVDLTSMVMRHQHTIDTSPDSAFIYGSPLSSGGHRNSGCTSWAVSEGADAGHSHDWVRNADGSITIAWSDGHNHSILEDDTTASGYSSVGVTPRADNEFDRSGTRREHGHMTQQNTGGSAPPDPAEQVRLLTVRADEADRSLVTERTRADAATATADGLRAELATTKERLKALEVQLAAGASAVETAAVIEQRTRADAAERELADIRARQPEIIRRRSGLIAKATAVLGPTFRTDGLTDREILVAGVRHLRPKEDTGPHVSDEYLARRFDSLVDDRTAHSASLARASETLAIRADAVPAPQNKPRVPWADQWKTGAGRYQTRKDS